MVSSHSFLLYKYSLIITFNLLIFSPPSTPITDVAPTVDLTIGLLDFGCLSDIVPKVR